MIRVALYTAGFCAITVMLILIQPGATPPPMAEPMVAEAVTRNAPSFDAVRLAAPDDMRQMTWSAIARINAATGRHVAPGRPGSVLHAVVQKSLGDPSRSPDGMADAYRVRAGDSLVSIAQAIYGDANMTGPLYAANADQLADPRDLAPGQVLVLPRR